jgi:hypothetical protein
MAKDNTLLYVGLGALAYFLYTRYTGSTPLSHPPAVAQLAPANVNEYYTQRITERKPPIRVPREGQTITLPVGQQPPTAPPGFYWTVPITGTPMADETTKTWTLTRTGNIADFKTIA